MKGYISYFKLYLISSLQYKVAAIAGIFTQFFWGFMYIFIYQAFYTSSHVNQPINFEQLVQYLWLHQAFFALIYLNVDREITESIKSGSVAYELTKPYDIYFFWYIKVLAKKYATTILRFLPIIIISLLLPKPYGLNLPISNINFGLFLMSLFLASFIIAGLIMLINIFTFFTYSDSGLTNILLIVIQLLSGFVLPVPLLPDIIKRLTYLLPFRLMGDLPFRIYSGNMPINEAILSIFLQIIWILFLVIIGKILIKNATKKLYIQGG